MPSITLGNLRRSWGFAAAIAFALLTALWIAHVLGRPVEPLARWIAPIAGLLVLVWGSLHFLGRSAASSPTPTDRPLAQRLAAQRLAAQRLAGFLLLAALLVRLTGISHEVFERAYLDEGTYYHHAEQINAGHWQRPTFVYPHLTYNAYAFALWLSSLFPEIRDSWASSVSGTPEGLAHEWLVLRLVVALLSAFTVLPVLRIGRFLAGPAGALLAGMLYVFSPLFNEGSHLIISDYPAAAVATFCLAICCRLAAQELTRDYVAAGMLAGAAAAIKYPAGTVVFAVVAIWIVKRVIARRIELGALRDIALCATASLVVFLATMPSFFAAPLHAINGPRGMLFGLRQYSGGGWIGVMPDSNWLYYLDRLSASLFWPALILGFFAPLLLRGQARRNFWWIAPFPIAYFLLVGNMNMVVERNLAPIVPVLAAISAAGTVALGRLLRQRIPARVPTALLLAGLAFLVLAGPVWVTLEQTIGFAKPSTRDLMRRWVEENIPTGSSILREGYTPRLDDRWALRQSRFATRVDREQLAEFDYVLLASASYGRFLRGDQVREPHQFEMADRYREILDHWPLVHSEEPGPWRRGPELRLHRPPPTGSRPPP